MTALGVTPPGPGRLCAATRRPFAEGDRIVSALVETPAGLERLDYAADAWPGPPAGTVAHWPGRIPASRSPKRPTMNDDLLLECLDRLASPAEPEQERFRYVAALLLMRRKRLRFDDVRAAGGREFLRLTCAKTGRRYEVADPRLGESELDRVQADVFRVLGWE